MVKFQSLLTFQEQQFYFVFPRLFHGYSRAINIYTRCACVLSLLGKLRVHSNWPWPNQQPQGPGVVLCKTSAPTPSFDQCYKLNLIGAGSEAPAITHSHFRPQALPPEQGLMPRSYY